MIRNELDILQDVSLRLESAEIAFMLTGSMAMNYYAQPRMTRDLDLVIKIAADQVDIVMRLFKDHYYVDRVAITKAINIDPASAPTSSPLVEPRVKYATIQAAAYPKKARVHKR